LRRVAVRGETATEPSHFVHKDEMVAIGSGAERLIDTIHLYTISSLGGAMPEELPTPDAVEKAQTRIKKAKKN
jgi:hypothetical protein